MSRDMRVHRMKPRFSEILGRKYFSPKIFKHDINITGSTIIEQSNPCNRRRGSHIFWTIGSQMAVRFTALHAYRPPFTPRNIPGTHFC
jgi:hypothetical protein